MQGGPSSSYSWPSQLNSQPHFSPSSYLNPPHQDHQPQPRPNLQTNFRSNYNHSSEKCQICKKRGHIAATCRFRYAKSRNNHYNPQNLQTTFSLLNLNPTATSSFTSSDIPEWLPDTAATFHMTFDPQLVESVQSYQGPTK